MNCDSTQEKKRIDHVYAILRYDLDAADNVPIEVRVTVKKIVLDPQAAEAEVKRLNALNQAKGCLYFSQLTRIESGVLDTVRDELSAASLEQAQSSQA